MRTDSNTTVVVEQKRARLRLIKERYRKVVLKPRRDLENYLRDAFDDDVTFDLN